MSQLITMLNTEETIVYSKNNCPKCMLLKKVLSDAGVPFVEVNIEESGLYEDYVTYITEVYQVRELPVIHPARETNLAPWSGFQPDLSDELVEFYENNRF